MLFSKIIQKKFDAVLGRYEGGAAVYSFEPSAFPGLCTEAYDIPAEVPGRVPGDADVCLRGMLYFYEKPCAEKLVVFDHGIGAGHRAYLREIERLARGGYTVYAYDHTGCDRTGGEGIRGFAQGIRDLDRVLTVLHTSDRFAPGPRAVIGHSWGGYAAMNVTALHPEVSRVVSLAGFVSARALEEQYLPKMFLRYSEEVMERERQHNPRYADMDACSSLRQSEAALLHLQSTDDQKVLYSRSMEPLQKALAGRPHTEFITTENRHHDPHRTTAAAAAGEQVLRRAEEQKKQLRTKEAQKKFQAEQDWMAVTEQDPVMWEKIFAFLREPLA